ncbi:open rectifier potassium channel protein 1 [Bombus flavifrons]|uniref:open rectifier potassium channel protein 1 n=1 Tax=Bombus flavifrons TaxID=103934 RepID=UPI0037037A8F
MSKKQWLVLLMLFLTYLLLGASIFYHIESRLEIERVEEAKRERIEINALLHAHYMPNLNHDHDEILGKLTRYCGKSVYNYTDNETDPLKWDFYNSFYFAYTVVSTIGYGNLAPTNMLGRILMIFYGLIGIPMNGILLTQLGEFFGHVFVKAHQKYKSYKRDHNDYYTRKLTKFETGKVGLAAQIFAHLMPGFVMFIFFPAFVFSHYEGWSYDEAVYYAFVTLTTIGFGDYVAGQDNSKGSGFFFMLYKTFLICWISFGLGYTVMIMTFIARGMRSKKITRIEHKLAINLKHTQSKIWNEFNKEINYLRRAFNELQLSKVKRVYIDECYYEIPPSKFPRSNSFPDLRDLLYGSKEKDKLCNRPRRRANSEVVPTEDQITRVVSETDLQRIDKTATFATHAMVQPAELLARLVNILGYIPPATEDTGADDSNQTTFISQDTGYRGNRLEENNSKVYSEEEPTYTSSTGPGLWTIGHEKIPAYRFANPRSRAASEIRLHETRKEDRNTERTWSGPTAARKIHELMKSRISESSGKEHGIKERKFSKLRNFALTRSVSKALVSSAPWKGRFSMSSEKKNSELDHEINRETGQSFPLGSVAIDDRRDSTTSNLRRHYYTHTGAGSNLNTETTNNLLEETSLADFLRALTALHASVVTNGSWTSATNTDQIQRNQPRRKMGTASLTPPKLPSLFTLFSPSPPTSTTQSNQNTITQEFNANSNENKLPWPQNRRESRRGSLVFVAPTTTKSRRFSLRPVATPISPPTPPKNDTPFLSDSQQMPYESRSTSLFESLKEPLISTERAPGLSTPIKSFLNDRRFSLRPTQNPNGCSIDNNPAALVPTLKAVPRWKAGMLQRQISQMNLRRRARAFSLSDVHAEDLKERAEPFDLSSSNCKKHNYDAKEYHKDISPNKSEREDLKNDRFAKSIENSDQFASSVCTSAERYSSFSQESALTNSVRLEEKNVRIFEPHNQSTSSIASTENINHLNEHTSCPPLDIYNEEKFASSSTEKQELQESLVEVKIENPITNIVRNPFTADVSLNNSLDSLSELKVEKHGSHLPINKS